MKRFTLVVAVVSVPGFALGQVPSRGQPAAAVPLQRTEKSAIVGPAAADGANDAFQRSGGSLYHMTASNPIDGRREASLFAVPKPDPKRIKKHDLVTVIVREESDSQTKATTDTKKNAEFNAILQQYVQLQDFAVRTRNPSERPPQFQFGADRSFKGEGTVDRSDSMSARVQATVIDVKPNGTLVLEATKRIKMDEEEITFTLTGTVRAEDVTIDNSVLSTQLAGLELEKSTKGAARDASKRGWVVKFFDALNPF